MTKLSPTKSTNTTRKPFCWLLDVYYCRTRVTVLINIRNMQKYTKAKTQKNIVIILYILSIYIGMWRLFHLISFWQHLITLSVVRFVTAHSLKEMWPTDSTKLNVFLQKDWGVWGEERRWDFMSPPQHIVFCMSYPSTPPPPKKKHHSMFPLFLWLLSKCQMPFFFLFLNHFPLLEIKLWNVGWKWEITPQQRGDVDFIAAVDLLSV